MAFVGGKEKAKKAYLVVLKVTSQGGGSRVNSVRCRPKNKNKRRSWKKYRGQGRP